MPEALSAGTLVVPETTNEVPSDDAVRPTVRTLLPPARTAIRLAIALPVPFTSRPTSASSPATTCRRASGLSVPIPTKPAEVMRICSTSMSTG